MRYRLAHAKQSVPMPERGPGVFFTADKEGEFIDEMNPYYARMIADKDLLPVEAEEDKPRATAKPEGGK